MEKIKIIHHAAGNYYERDISLYLMRANGHYYLINPCPDEIMTITYYTAKPWDEWWEYIGYHSPRDAQQEKEYAEIFLGVVARSWEDHSLCYMLDKKYDFKSSYGIRHRDIMHLLGDKWDVVAHISHTYESRLETGTGRLL